MYGYCGNDRDNDYKSYKMCNRCGHSIKSNGHYEKCIAPRMRGTTDLRYCNICGHLYEECICND